MIRLFEDQLASHRSDMFKIMILGELIDRGPQSANFIELAETSCDQCNNVGSVQGNHKELYLPTFVVNERAACSSVL